MMSVASRPLLSGQDLDRAIDRTRAELAALLQGPEMRGSELRVPEMRGLETRSLGLPGLGLPGLELRSPGNGGEAGGPQAVAQARALLGALLDRRVTERAAQLDGQDARAVASARADRNEAIAVTGALLYWLPAGDLAWPEVALTLGRLSYDRYTDPWPGAEPPDPDDLDAACDLLLRGARYDDADERTTLYLFLALRDREHLLACPGDARAAVSWGRRLLTFPGAGGLGHDGLHDMLELELLGRADARDHASASGSWSPRPLQLAAALI
jgi:hypothetical protein